jgi:hypothetical protein
MQYGEVLTRSFRIAWRNRYLWFLAVLAGEAGAGGGGGGSGGNRIGGPGDGGGAPDPADVLQTVLDWVGAHLALIIAVGIILLAVWLVLFVISCIAAGALVRAAAEHDAERPFGLGPAWRAGAAAFWRILGLRLIELAAVLAVLAVFGGLVVVLIMSIVNENGGGVALAISLGLLLLLVFIPVAIFFGVLMRLALRSIVLELQGPVAAIRLAFALIFRRFGRVAVTWLISVAVGIAAGLAVTAVLVIVALPFVGLFLAALAAGSKEVMVADLVLGLLVLLAAALVAGGAYGAFISSYWTLAFRRLDLDPVPAPPSPGPLVSNPQPT